MDMSKNLKYDVFVLWMNNMHYWYKFLTLQRTLSFLVWSLVGVITGFFLWISQYNWMRSIDIYWSNSNWKHHRFLVRLLLVRTMAMRLAAEMDPAELVCTEISSGTDADNWIRWIAICTHSRIHSKTFVGTAAINSPLTHLRADGI